MNSTKRKHSGGWQERNRVNKSNPKNIYCLHCKYFGIDESHYTGYCKYIKAFSKRSIINDVRNSIGRMTSLIQQGRY